MVWQNTGKFRPNRTEKTDQPTNESEPVFREESSEFRLRQVIENESIDAKYGFERMKESTERTGFLLNVHSTEILDEDKRLCAAVDYYFMEEDGSRFKVSYPFKPYFYILTKSELIQEVSQFLTKKFLGTITKIETVSKEDLDLPNHLIGLKQKYVKLSFCNQTDLIKVRKEILKFVRKNKEKQADSSYYTEMLTSTLTVDGIATASSTNKSASDQMENILDIREYDVPYHVRVSIDLKIFCGSWYTVKTRGSTTDAPQITLRSNLIERPEPIVLAFDIETTKLPLKFPDSATDQIMMISYMIDAQESALLAHLETSNSRLRTEVERSSLLSRDMVVDRGANAPRPTKSLDGNETFHRGYLITNREILSADIEDFEYTPKPEFEGKFTIYNEPNEMALIQRFFDHINDIRPHIFVTYNGDFFDWPFVEARAAAYDLDMKQEIGFYRNKEGVYTCRPAIHMDCLCWVKRDSYLPVGSQNLKAVAKAKLRYDPVELDPEEMCPLAASDPQVLSNYSVSDAVATYYLYMQYVHPFIFALCTIIPCEPDEVLRKGSGTLCEALLMVEAFHGNIIFPNKEETILNKLTQDGHVLHQETYVGGHVEALESGVFRADIPCRFRIVPEAINKLIDQVPKTLEHAIVVEEGVPLSCVTNLEEITKEIKDKLEALKAQPMRLERPLIYHLDVGAMYPNIILTNRLQPCAMVNETICAACDFNKPNATCQRHMTWMMREEYMPATRNEYQRIQQQLETEKFPPKNPGGPLRAFHELSRLEQAEWEKKRLSIYCRKVYKKLKVVRVAERTTTICQKENSFYVDTVKAFRDRRYEYKGLSKRAKQEVTNAIKSGDASEIKSAKNREVLYDSLQLAHKCILNSFYGYVMRRGARWHSMEMAGIVCFTGANIIMRAREIIEQVGRPLELDTDGIWCILPASFPENFTILTDHEKKKKFVVSYPNTVLNAMVKEHYTNDQYHDLVNPEKLEYEQKSENSIFFEIDGPYRAMVLPASKEEGKKLKKRYAVFNFDGSLAELKGFEVKRRGELQLIKNFQSSVFEAFLKGDTLETCYAAVAQVADYWLDVLFSHGRNMPDSELFDLISENRSMSKKLEEYGTQKSTSISTAKRLAEFLGDQMVKDAGLACRYVISKKPDGAPVTERAIPLAIFQSEEAVQKHYLRKWLKDNSITDIEIRDILDWNYYIERLGGTIQKIITIPAAMQGIPNPVPRVRHPDWLHKKMLEKNDTHKQRRITDMFSFCAKPVASNEQSEEANSSVSDIEDAAGKNTSPVFRRPMATVNKRKRGSDKDNEFGEEELDKTWREVLGNPPVYGVTRESRIAWILFQKRKWRFQALQKCVGQDKRKKKAKGSLAVLRSSASGTLGSFLQKAQRSLLTTPWQIIQIAPTSRPDEFRIWALVEGELHQLKLTVPRMYYANLRSPKDVEQGAVFKKCNRILPRSKPVYNLYLYSVPEDIYQQYRRATLLELTDASVEGVYERNVTHLFRALMSLGCVCKVARGVRNLDSFSLDQLEIVTFSRQKYLDQDAMKHLYFYHHKHASKPQHMFALFLTPLKKAIVIVVDTVRTNLMPNMMTLYAAERTAMLEKNSENRLLPPEGIEFQIRIETDMNQVYKSLDKALQLYKDERKGPTLIAVQSAIDMQTLQKKASMFADFPLVRIHNEDIDELYNVIDWQKVGARTIIRHYLNSENYIGIITEQCRYFHLPVGNHPKDGAIFGTDLFFARHLAKANHVLWCSPLDKPDLGGSEENDMRLLAENLEGSSEICNQPGWYSSVCIELHLDSLAINTLLQAHHVTDIEGTSGVTAFDASTTTSLDAMVSGISTQSSYDETTRCADAFKVLRTMVCGWVRDITVHRNKFADFQATHFYRWLRNPRALLYDPALLRSLQNLMKKLFLQLVAEFKRLGCTVIYANFNKIVLCTRKKNVEDALANVEFVLASIKNKELFHSLEMGLGTCWEMLVWLDSANYGGIYRQPKENETRNIEENNDEDMDDDLPLVGSVWNIIEQLPEGANCRENFNTIIAGYIMSVYQRVKQTENNAVAPVVLSQPSFGLANHENVLKYAKNLLRTDVAPSLFQITEKIHNSLNQEPDGTSAALGFVKAICHVLSLDPALREPVDQLKSDLLRLIGVGEFSDKAVWKDPSVSYIIPQIICRTCNHCRDIDLGRDPHRTEEGWQCPLCKAAYDTKEIEGILLDIISKKFLAYNLQDLQCKKCGEIKMENLILHCHCASEFKCLMSRDDLIKLLQTFLSLADRFSMVALSETVQETLKLIY